MSWESIKAASESQFQISAKKNPEANLRVDLLRDRLSECLPVLSGACLTFTEIEGG